MHAAVKNLIHALSDALTEVTDVAEALYDLAL